MVGRDVARQLGVAERAASLSEALAGADVVVPTVPFAPDRQPFLDLNDLTPGAFVTAVDLGRSWTRTGFRQHFALLATDDTEQSRQLAQSGKMVCDGPFDAELGDLILGSHPGRTDDRQITGLVFAGIALADLGLAALIDDRARARNVGRMLPA